MLSMPSPAMLEGTMLLPSICSASQDPHQKHIRGLLSDVTHTDAQHSPPWLQLLCLRHGNLRGGADTGQEHVMLLSVFLLI